MTPDQIDAFPRRLDGQFDRRYKPQPTLADIRAYNAEKHRPDRFFIVQDAINEMRQALHP